MIEEVPTKVVAEALTRLASHRPVLVEIEDGDPGEGKPLFAVTTDELGVNRLGGRAGGQTENDGAAGSRSTLDQLGDFGGDRVARVARRIENVDPGAVFLHRARRIARTPDAQDRA